MNIVHVVNDHFSHSSGYSIRTDYIIRFQKSLGLNPTVLISPYHNHFGDRSNSIGKLSYDGTDYYQCGLQPNFSRPLIHFSLWFYRRIEQVLFYHHIIRIISKIKPSIDLIHAHSPHLVGWPALKAARYLDLPFVYEMRGLWEESGVANGRIKDKSWLYKYHKQQETKLAKKSDGLVTISKSLLQEIKNRKAVPENTIVVPNGIEINRFNIHGDGKRIRTYLGIDDDTILLGYIGTLRFYECLDDVIKATAKLKCEKISVCLLFVGDGEARKSLEKTAKNLDVDNQVHFIGRVPHEEIQHYYDAIDIFTITRSSKHIGLIMPIKPLEALAMGKPLIISDLPVMHEFVEDGETGLFYSPGDVTDLADRIKKLLKNKPLINRLSQNGRNWVINNYTWDKSIAQYPSFYDEVTRYHNQNSI